MADSPTNPPADLEHATTRAELLVLHHAARARRNAAPGGSHAWEQAAADVGRIEVAIAALERAMDPPRV